MRKPKKKSSTSKVPKQLTLDVSLNSQKEEKTKLNLQIQEKQISITQISAFTEKNQAYIKVTFKLNPSKVEFSKIKSELHFDGQLIRPVLIKIPQGLLSRNDFELTHVLDMVGIAEGQHLVKVEMYEFCLSEEKLAFASKETQVNYVPQTREAVAIRVPIVKSIAGEDLEVLSESEKEIYREIHEASRKEQKSQRDKW